MCWNPSRRSSRRIRRPSFSAHATTRSRPATDANQRAGALAPLAPGSHASRLEPGAGFPLWPRVNIAKGVKAADHEQYGMGAERRTLTPSRMPPATPRRLFELIARDGDPEEGCGNGG